MLHYIALRDNSNNGLKETEGASQIFHSNISVGKCGLLFKSFRLFRTFSGRSSVTEMYRIFG